MAYQIRYEDTAVIKKTKPQQKIISAWIVSLCVVALLAGSLRLESVQNFLIPGDPEVTKAAFSAFTRNLENGDSFTDAATAFCRQIIQKDIDE